ncbi:hypothetical protein WA026_000447 [Henosepilachna vigintioctopunctata]|uniref:methylated diphthine methylhydrolase n=1 Tax=Henosepilachna vigintioctopunctata TaxID=420089 RepID=A0AAW1V476_9CUCU
MSNYEKLNNTSDDDLPRNVHIKTLYKWKTDFNADSVEWCPHNGFKNIFVCGNYQLIAGAEESGIKQRVGRILLFSVSAKDGLKLELEIETAAVLDQKWCHQKINQEIILAVANSDSAIELYKLQKEHKNITLKKVNTFSFPNEDDELLILSLDWSNNKSNSEPPEIICSDSKGGVHILLLTEKELVLKASIIKFHEFETWIAGFYYWDTNIFFSGGDDCILYKYDQRVGSEPISRNRSHEAGVTSLHSNCSQEYILASGSYDEHVRIWDIRNFKCPKSEIKTPGPLWRVKWDPFSQNHILVASMLGGVHVLSGLDLMKPKIVDSYYEHGNIAYGVDWSFLTEDEVRNYPQEGNVMISSCSFYDNLLCVSKLKCDI